MKRFSSIIGESHSLGSDSPLPEVSNKGHVEITMTHPLTDSWSNMNTDKQKAWYKNAFRQLTTYLTDYLESAEIHFEYHSNGHVHAHALIIMNEKKFFIVGLLADLAKMYHSSLPKQKFKRWHIYNEKFMYKDMNRYCAAPITIQYRYSEEKRDGILAIDVWKKYIHKTDI